MGKEIPKMSGVRELHEKALYNKRLHLYNNTMSKYQSFFLKGL